MMTPIEAKLTEAKLALNTGDVNTAMIYLYDIFEADPHNLEAVDTLFLYYYQMKHYDTAIQIISPLINHMPDADRLSNRGLAFFQMKRFKEALDDYNGAIELDPNHAIAWNNKADVLKSLDNFDESIKCLKKSADLKSDFAQPVMNLGQVYHDLREYDLATKAFEDAIKIDPSNGDVHFAFSLHLLKIGDYPRGLSEYEQRWNSAQGIGFKRQFKQPGWHKFIDLTNQSIFVYAEQGLGDAIQMARFFKILQEKGARVVAEVDKPLIELFKTVPGVDEVVIRNGYPTKAVDYQLPIMSLMFQLGINADNIPNADGYIKANNKKVKGWRKKLGKKTKPRIGIAWSSSSDFSLDYKRSMSFENFSKALPEGFEYVCLQPFVKQTDLEAIKLRNDVRIFTDDLKDFSETAALVENLDLVISTCTSVPHLSGAMNKPTWIAIPYSADWRWGTDGTDSKWYSSVTLYRQQKPGAWDEVLSQIKVDLQAKYMHESS